MQQRTDGSSVRFGWVLATMFALCLPCAWASQLQPVSPKIDKLVLAETMQPVSADELQRALATANRDGSAALLVELNTPGGLLDSTRMMAGAILSSRVPVIVYVGPAGARAGSAGFFLLEAADVAAMVPGTNAGAAHPVVEMGKGGFVRHGLTARAMNDGLAALKRFVKMARLKGSPA